MTSLQLEALVLDLQTQINDLKSQISKLHLDYVTKLQWKELDRLREADMVSVVNNLKLIEQNVATLEKNAT